MKTTKMGIFHLPLIVITSVAIGICFLFAFEKIFPNLSERIKDKVAKVTIEYCSSRLPPQPSIKDQFSTAFSNLIAAHLLEQGNFSKNNKVEIQDNSDTLLSNLLYLTELKLTPIGATNKENTPEELNLKTQSASKQTATNDSGSGRIYELEMFRKDPKIANQIIVQISTFDQKSKNKIAESALELSLESVLDKKKPDSN